MATLKIRKTTKKDIALIYNFIKKIAQFEKLEHEFVLNKQTLQKNLFGPQKFAYCLIGEVNGSPVAYAIYFFNFSTFLGKPGLYLEDLFVLPEFRSQGYGLKFLKHLAGIAAKKNCGRMEWMVLDWNIKAQKFYEQLGAKNKKEWFLYRMDAPQIKKLAASK